MRGLQGHLHLQHPAATAKLHLGPIFAHDRIQRRKEARGFAGIRQKIGDVNAHFWAAFFNRSAPSDRRLSMSKRA